MLSSVARSGPLAALASATKQTVPSLSKEITPFFAISANKASSDVSKKAHTNYTLATQLPKSHNSVSFGIGGKSQ